jgi:HisJ family histidinol phosphate phosphatase
MNGGLPMLVDGHMHLENGPLTKEYVMEFINEAYKQGFDRIQILDHTHRFKEFEVIYQGVKEASDQQREWLANKKMKFKDTLSSYVRLINEVKEEELPIEVLFGLEVCYVPEYKEEIRRILESYQFDFLVGAIHSIDGLLYDMPWSKEILWDKYNVDDIYHRYYELIFEQKETAKRHFLSNGIINNETADLLNDEDTLAISKKLFEKDLILLKQIKSKYVTLKSKKSGKFVRVYFNNFNNYVLLFRSHFIITGQA